MTARHFLAGRRPAATALSAWLIVGSLVGVHPANAAQPYEGAGAEYLAGALGGAAGDFRLLHERRLARADGSVVWAAKYLDERTGAVRAVYRDPATGVLGTDEPATGAGATALETKGDDELREAVAAATTSAGALSGETTTAGEPAGAETIIPVGVWLEVDVAAAESAVMAAHPELTWDGGRPLVDDLATARAIRAELAAAQAGARVAAFDTLRAEVASLGGTIGYASTNAPLAYVDVPATAVEALAALPGVVSLGLERTWIPAMSSAGPAVDANWTGGGEDQGSGVRVAIVEYHNVRNSGDLAGRVVASYSTTGALAYAGGNVFDHPTWVAGAIAGGNPSQPGVAPGALIVSASTGGGGASLARDRSIIAAADWAANAGGGDADVINASIGQDTATGSEEARRYFDSLVHEQGRLAVAAAGNFTTFGHWAIVSPGTAWNVLTVGGTDDRGTGGRGDDVIWYAPGSNGSNYHDAAGTAWNPHGDFNKPNVSAPAVSVRTANGLAASGTSAASPIVAGIAAQLIARAPTLTLRPEGTRAIVMAGAMHHTLMPDGSWNADHEGTGTASALWSNRLLTAGDGAWGGHRLGAMAPGEVVTQEIAVVAGQRVKVVVAWNSHTSGAGLDRSDRLRADIDLRVFQPGGAVAGSFSFDNNYEWVEFTATHTGTAVIEVRAVRFEAASERFALAWAKTSPYSDVESSPFYADILWIAQRQITLGCGGGRYCPDTAVLREQMASFLVRARGLPPSGRDHFDDDAGSIHHADINALAESGITVGCAPRRFCPTLPVSRAEMATMLVRALGLAPSSHDHFTDDEGSGHEDAINALAASGITRGCGGTSFCPDEAVSREAMAAFLHRALGP